LRKQPIILIIAICLVLGTLAFWLRSRITPEELRVLIERDLPLGSSSGKVLLWLDSLKTEHSWPVDSHGAFPGATRLVPAAIRGFRKGNLLSDGVFMRFYFDDKDRLVGYRVHYSLRSRRAG
jgi:hypothetical protein